MSRKNKKKKETFFTKLANFIMTLIFASIMLCGIQGFGFAPSGLKFAQISDAHFYTGSNNTTFKLIAESPKLLDDAVNQVNETPNLDFVMFTGDQIDKSFEKELQAFLTHAKNLKYPWYFVFGNHDTCIGGYLTKNLYLDIVRQNNDNFKFENSYYSFVPKKGYKVIVLDTIIRDRLTSNGMIDETQLAWLDNELKNSQKDVVLIFMHVALEEPFASPNHRLLNENEVRAVLAKYKNPTAVFQGHYHAAMIRQKDNILYVNCPSLVSYPNAFRIVTVNNYKNKVVFNIQMKETREKNIQRLAKVLVFSSSIYTGEDKDQNAVVEIKKK